MVITWDEPKRLANIDKHGLDFADLTVDFFLSSKIVSARQGRFVAIGAVERKPVAVVFSPLGSQALSVISMRPASKAERRLLT